MIEITQSTQPAPPVRTTPRTYSAKYGDIDVRAVYDTSDRPSVQFSRSVTRKPVDGSTLRTAEYGVMTAIGVEPLLPLFDEDARLWLIEFLDAVKALESATP